MIIFIGCKQSTSFPLDIPSTINLNKISTDSLVNINKLNCINYAIFDEPCLELINDKSKKAIRLTIKRKQITCRGSFRYKSHDIPEYYKFPFWSAKSYLLERGNLLGGTKKNSMEWVS
jgi:hypothetical protein